MSNGQNILILPYITPQARRRFWMMVFFTDKDKCWYWHGATNPNGHGVFRVKYKLTVLAHRFAFVSVFKIEPEVVRHACNNRPCVNPAHLIKGSQHDNVHDAIKAGTHISVAARKAANAADYDLFEEVLTEKQETTHA